MTPQALCHMYKYLPIITLFFFYRYQAKVARINESTRKVLVHFEGWNARHDTWFAFDSTSLRPLHLLETSQEQSSKRKVCVCGLSLKC